MSAQGIKVKKIVSKLSSARFDYFQIMFGIVEKIEIFIYDNLERRLYFILLSDDKQ